MTGKKQDNREKLDLFMNEKIKVHIKLSDYTWLNGFVSNKLRDDVYSFEEDKLGCVFLFVNTITSIKPWRERR